MTFTLPNLTASQFGVGDVDISAAGRIIRLTPKQALELGQWLLKVRVPATPKESRGEISLSEAKATDTGNRAKNKNGNWR